MVHLVSQSPWLPELRTLVLRGNALNATAYMAFQAVVSLKSLQTLDLGENALTGPIEDTLTLLYCEADETGGSSTCNEQATGVAGPLLRVVTVDGNNLTGATRLNTL